jgi:hypothetical protein
VTIRAPEGLVKENDFLILPLVAQEAGEESGQNFTWTSDGVADGPCLYEHRLTDATKRAA